MNYNNYNIRRCSAEDVNNILELQDVIIEGLQQKEVLRKNTREMFECCVKEPNLTLGVFAGKELIALAILVDAKGTAEDLSVGLEKFSAPNAANFKLVLVKKEYRGNELQKRLMWILEKYAYNRGYESLCTTVSEINIPSLRNVKGLGYQVDHSAVKYGGLSRLVLYKDIRKSVVSYNEKILQVISSNEGKDGIDESFLEKIDFDRCFKGDIDIAATGDILEYEEAGLGKIHYGILVKEDSPKVLIYVPEKSEMMLIAYSEKIGNMILKEIYINTTGGL